MPASLFSHAKFLKSASDLIQLPPESQREVAFAGRSNSGKSSVINALTGRRQLARVSKTPGRTQLINYFAVDGERFLVDLPGYGFAKVPAATRAPWAHVLGAYLRSRKQLAGLALVMDVRHPLTQLDRMLLEWFAPAEKPVHVFLTKADKLSRSAALHMLRSVRSSLAETSPNWTAQLFSSLKRTGIEDAEAVLRAWLTVDALEAVKSEAQRDAARPSADGHPLPVAAGRRSRIPGRKTKSPGLRGKSPGTKMP